MKPIIEMPNDLNFYQPYESFSSKEVWETLSDNTKIALTKFHQLGIVSPGGAFIHYMASKSAGHKSPRIEIVFKEKKLLTLEIFANQIIQVTPTYGSSLHYKEYMEMTYLEAKNTFQKEDKKLSRSRLGRYIILKFWGNNFYLGKEVVTLACSNMSLEALTGFMDEKLTISTILGFEDLPDSWLDEFLDTRMSKD